MFIWDGMYCSHFPSFGLFPLLELAIISGGEDFVDVVGMAYLRLYTVVAGEARGCSAFLNRRVVMQRVARQLEQIPQAFTPIHYTSAHADHTALRRQGRGICETFQVIPKVSSDLSFSLPKKDRLVAIVDVRARRQSFHTLWYKATVCMLDQRILLVPKIAEFGGHGLVSINVFRADSCFHCAPRIIVLVVAATDRRDLG